MKTLRRTCTIALIGLCLTAAAFADGMKDKTVDPSSDDNLITIVLILLGL